MLLMTSGEGKEDVMATERTRFRYECKVYYCQLRVGVLEQRAVLPCGTLVRFDSRPYKVGGRDGALASEPLPCSYQDGDKSQYPKATLE